MVVWPTSRHTSEDAIIRLAAPPRHQGLVEVGITDSPHSCHSRDQLYRQIRQSPIPPPGINLEKTHRAAFSFFVKCCEALWVSPISGWNQLCTVFHCFFPPLLFRASIILHGAWMLKGQHLFSVSSSPGGATKFPQRQIFSVKTWIMSSQTLPHFQLYLCPRHNFLYGIDTKAKECISSLICFLSSI